MALRLLGNPTMAYASNKMAILLRGFVGNTKNPLFLVGTSNYLRQKPSNNSLIVALARFKKCENKAIILLGMIGIPNALRAIILLPVLLGIASTHLFC